MSWWNPLTWFGTKALATGSLTDEDQRAISVLRNLLEGEKDAIDVLLSRLSAIEQADAATAETLIPQLKRDIEAFENSSGILQELVRNKNIINGTVLAYLLTSSKKRR